MNYKPLPLYSEFIAIGLWAHLNEKTKKYKIYASEGYCFYVPTENLDENGNLLDEKEIMYATYRSTSCETIEQIKKKFVCVEIKDFMNII